MNAIHSSVPAGPRASSVWLKITVRLADDLDPLSAQLLDGGPDVVHLEVDQRARGRLFEQQTYRSGLEEQQSRRVEEAARLRLQQAGVELPGTLQVIGVLSNLEDLHETRASHTGSALTLRAMETDGGGRPDRRPYSGGGPAEPAWGRGRVW